MVDHDDGHGHDDRGSDEIHEGEAHGHDVEGLERVTAPMQAYGMREVGIGFVVLAVGLAVTFGLPLLT